MSNFRQCRETLIFVNVIQFENFNLKAFTVFSFLYFTFEDFAGFLTIQSPVALLISNYLQSIL